MNADSGGSIPPEMRAAMERSRAHSRALALAMEAWAAHHGGLGSAGGPDGYSELTFHWSPDERGARVELRLWADLADDDRPVIRVTLPETFQPRVRESRKPSTVAATVDAASETAHTYSASSVVCMRGTDLPLVEPDQRCEACAAQGTVGRAVRFTAAGEVHEIHRFCADCWPEQRARYEARWKHESRRERDAFLRNGDIKAHGGMSTAFESATWDGAETMIDMLREHAMHRGRPAEQDLRRLADEMLDARASRVGDMPLDVAIFIRQHTSRALPPDFVDGVEPPR